MCVQYRGGREGSVPRGCSVPFGVIMSTVEDVLSTILDVQYHWDVMSTVGGVQYYGGYSLLLFEYLPGTEQPHGTHDTPPPPIICIMISPHGTEYPTLYSTGPTQYSWYPPTVLSPPPPKVLNTHYTGW